MESWCKLIVGSRICNKRCNPLTFRVKHSHVVQVGLGVVHALPEGEMVDDVRRVEAGRGVGLHVVYVDVIDGEALAGSNVEATAHPIHFHVSIHLTTLLHVHGR